jgi:hypothetical protein
MTLRELLETLKCFGVKLTLRDGDTITAEPREMLTPAVRAALAEHHVALVALIGSGPSSTSSFDTLLAGLDGMGARPAAEVLQERLQTLADGLAGADPLVRELVRAEAVARLTTRTATRALRFSPFRLFPFFPPSGQNSPTRDLAPLLWGDAFPACLAAFGAALFAPLPPEGDRVGIFLARHRPADSSKREASA